MASTGLLTINLPAIASNWVLISDHIKQKGFDVECGAVVKADAYGLGFKRVATTLFAAGCKRFFVATLTEGLELREALGFGPSIVVFGGLLHGLSDDWLSQQLTPVLFDVDHIAHWLHYCRSKSISLPCVLKVDTGMHRLGISPDQLLHFLSSFSGLEQLQPDMLMSHLACADEPEHDLNDIQLNAFISIAEITKKVYPNIKMSLSNSAGSFLGEPFHFDVCRPGAALYGVNPTPGKSNPMRSVLNLALPVMQVRTINKGESVGYGATFVAVKETRLATVFGGYADGLLRFMSNQGCGWCGDIKVPMVGRVSMDSIIFDITDIDEMPDTIEVLNCRQSVDDLARYAGTIGYEVLTSLGVRYRREYICSEE